MCWNTNKMFLNNTKFKYEEKNIVNVFIKKYIPIKKYINKYNVDKIEWDDIGNNVKNLHRKTKNSKYQTKENRENREEKLQRLTKWKYPRLRDNWMLSIICC